VEMIDIGAFKVFVCVCVCVYIYIYIYIYMCVPLCLKINSITRNHATDTFKWHKNVVSELNFKVSDVNVIMFSYNILQPIIHK